MQRHIGVPLAAIGMSMALTTGCSSSPEIPAEVTAAHEQILDEYNCGVAPANIEITDLSAASQKQFGDSKVGVAYTDAEGIKLDDDLSTQQMAGYVIHETFHYCAGRGKEKIFDQPLEIPGIGFLTSVDGFVPYVNGNPTSGNTYIEEGVVEWLSKRTGDYQAHKNYAILSDVTEQIVQVREFDQETIDQTIVDLLKTDDLIGLVGLMKDKPAAEVSGQDIKDIVLLYMTSADAGQTPDPEAVRELLAS